MSDMKCPFCQQELEDANIHSSGLYFECPNCYDKQKEKDDNYTATPKVWQELIRTRKALEILLFTINRLENQNYKDCAWHLRLAIAKIETMGIADKALEQITALEQKE